MCQLLNISLLQIINIIVFIAAGKYYPLYVFKIKN